MRSNRSTGKRIQLHRMNLGLSPEAFGAQIGVSGPTMRRIEGGGNPQTRTAFLIAQSMEVPVTALFPVGGRQAVVA